MEVSKEKRVEEKKPIRSFKDLEVYQVSFEAANIIAREIIPKLPLKDPYNIRDQLARSSMAIPRLIAEGYGKRHQRLGFCKYLDDANSESNETQVTLEQAKVAYGHLLDIKLVDELVITYDRISRQTYNLSSSWSNFATKTRTSQPLDQTSLPASAP